MLWSRTSAFQFPLPHPSSRATVGTSPPLGGFPHLRTEGERSASRKACCRVSEPTHTKGSAQS